MFSANSAKVLALLPFQLLYVTLQYLILGLVSQFRRYKHDLPASLKMVAARAILRWNIDEGAIFNKTSVGAVLHDVARSNKQIVRNLPNYGKKFSDRAYWLVEQPDRTEQDLVLIYCHGGAYFLQLNSVQTETVLATYCLLAREKRKRVSILVLDYRLACDGYAFPSQMNDLNETYYSIRQSTKRVGLLGDSAGGNLVIGFTQFLKQRNAPPQDYPLVLAVISPWLTLFPDPENLGQNSSYLYNGDGDIVPFESFADSTRRKPILGKESRFSLVWSPAAKTPQCQKDWADIATFSAPNRKLFLLAGEDETLRDDAIYFAKYALQVPWEYANYGRSKLAYSAEELQYKTANVHAYIEPWGVHDAMMVFEKGLAAVKEGKTVKDLDDRNYYGIKRLVEFLEDAI